MKKYLLQVHLCRCFEAWVSMHSSRKGVYSFYQVPRKQKKVLVTQSCLTLFDPMDCSLLGSSVHGILQARMLEWVAMPFSSGSSQPRGWTLVSYIECRFLTVWATRYLGARPIQTKFSPWQLYHTVCAWVSWDLFCGCRCPAETSSSTQSPGAGESFFTILLFREGFFLISPFI